jgi:DNA-binding PadR family transcriptional regulator
VIYPTLTMLEELGHATVAESDGKKLYAITAEGTAYIDANKVALDQALRRM